MFAIIEKYRTPAQLLLGAIGISFIGFGFVGLDAVGGKHYIAKVGNQTVARYDLDQRVRQIEAAGHTADRQAVFDEMLTRAYLLEGAARLGIVVSDEQIKQAIVDNREFHDANGKFSQDRYQNLLANSHISEAQYFDELRTELTLQALNQILGSNVVSEAQAKNTLTLAAAPRQVRFTGIDPQAFSAKVAVNDDALGKFYEANKQSYRQLQSAQFQYLVLSPDMLSGKQSVSEDEIRTALADAEKNSKPARTVAHILIAVSPDADEAAKAKAKAEAEKIAAQAQAKPADFGALAKQYSQDDESKAKNGSLGEFAAGVLAQRAGKAFEDAAFALDEGGVSGVVESSYGYHIIKAEKVAKTDQAALRERVVQELQSKKAQQAYTKMREELADLTVNHAGELNTAAAKLGLSVQEQKTWLTRANASELKVPAAVVDALFSEDVFVKKHNSELINVDGAVWVVRPIDTKAESILPLAQVKERVREDFVRSESLRLANEEAKKLLAELQAGKKPALAWSPVESIAPQLLQQQWQPNAYRTLMQAAPKAGKPAYVQIEHNARPVLIEVQAIDSAAVDAQSIAAFRQFNVAQQGNALINAFVRQLQTQIKTQQGDETVSDSE